MNYDSFKGILNKEYDSYTEADHWINEHNNWVKNNNIDFTPTVFINNHQMPSDYTDDDLKIILPTMIDGIEKLKDLNIVKEELTI